MPDFVTYVGFQHFLGDNWCAKCSVCGKVLTKFAFTEDEAAREATEVLKGHRCRPRWP